MKNTTMHGNMNLFDIKTIEIGESFYVKPHDFVVTRITVLNSDNNKFDIDLHSKTKITIKRKKPVKE